MAKDERVSLIEPDGFGHDLNVIYIAPHGHGKDDINTAYLAEAAALASNGYAVINRGWKKAHHFDYDNENANCNNLNHLTEDVVKEEFFDPIINFCCRILKSGFLPYICIIHGVANSVRQRSKIKDLDILIGNGRGGKITAPDHLLQALAYYLFQNQIKCYVAGEKSNYSGRSSTNLNQLFSDPNLYSTQLYRPNAFRPRLPVIPTQSCGIPANSMQLEFTYSLRDSEDTAKLVGEYLGESIKDSFYKYNSELSDIRKHTLNVINYFF